MQIIVYSSICTTRLEYACRLVLGTILGHEPVFVSDRNEFAEAQGIRINYSHEPVEGSLQVIPHTILFEENIRTFTPEVNHWKGIPVLFSRHAPSYLPFDPFAAAFWMASRYEEYLPFEPDRHGRFTAGQSLAAKENFLGLPVVHLWADSLVAALRQLYPQFVAGRRTFAYQPTIDVDIAWAYLHRSFLRTSAGIARSLAGGRGQEVKERWRVLRGEQPDPYDQFDVLLALHHEYNLNATWFVEVGKHGKFDKNISPGNQAFRKLIAGLVERGDMGVHPSYASHLDEKSILTEKKLMESISGKAIDQSRQHFLRLKFPQTYEILIKCGFTKDYSMGYHDRPGFRAGLCVPFPWFNLNKNQEQGLTIVPFEIMDVTFSEYMKLSAEDALDSCRTITDRVKQVNGRLVSIWHNQPALPWKTHDWFELYWQLVRYCTGD